MDKELKDMTGEEAAAQTVGASDLGEGDLKARAVQVLQSGRDESLDRLFAKVVKWIKTEE